MIELEAIKKQWNDSDTASRAKLAANQFCPLVIELDSLRSQLAAANERAEVAERKFGKLMAWAASKRSDIHIWWHLVGITGGRTPEDQVRRAAGLEDEPR